jgi:very-short-patch-repair endonuclease
LWAGWREHASFALLGDGAPGLARLADDNPMSDAPTYHTSTDKRCKTSELEEAILSRLGELGLDLVPQVKRRSWVFDAAVQGTKILIEVNGAYWHSLPHAKERDAKKAEWAAKHGYIIITVTEEAYQDDPDGVLLQVIDQVEQARALTQLDRSDTEGPVSSYQFDDWRDDFIQSLSGDLNVRKACIAADISRSNAYHRRDTDEEFRRAWDEAIENACDLLEGVYWTRAIEQSDRATEFLLKANRRDKYGDKLQLDGVLRVLAEKIDYTKLSAAQIEALANGDEPLSVLLGAGDPDSSAS